MEASVEAADVLGRDMVCTVSEDVDRKDSAALVVFRRGACRGCVKRKGGRDGQALP